MPAACQPPISDQLLLWRLLLLLLLLLLRSSYYFFKKEVPTASHQLIHSFGVSV
jgi:hypothetical protein